MPRIMKLPSNKLTKTQHQIVYRTISPLRHLKQVLLSMPSKYKANAVRQTILHNLLAHILEHIPTLEKALHRDYDDIGKEETFNVKQTSVPSNHDKSDTGENYHWGEDDDDVSASIDMQQILKQNEQAKESFVNKPVPTLNKCEIQGNRKLPGPQKDKQSAEDFFRSIKAIFIEKELKELKNEEEAIKIHNQENSLTHLNLQTLNNNQNAMPEEKEHPKSSQGKDFETEPKEITNQISFKSIETKFENSTDNSVEITGNRGFRTANGKDISLSKEGKKHLEDLLKELNENASDNNAEDGLLCIKNQIISKRNNLLSQKKNIKTSLKRCREDCYCENANELSVSEKRIESDEPVIKKRNNFARKNLLSFNKKFR
uniref:Uncharacterized protein n=1 Tax=Glossina brevipalpis TaxID=37001 RepID=A0A1A9W9X9_9MUSC